uniref:Uncharacterized protein n=1 Tax=Arion vulgaris TaxID=1028688 RepID=A0A0B7B1Y7_9EUPU
MTHNIQSQHEVTTRISEFTTRTTEKSTHTDEEVKKHLSDLQATTTDNEDPTLLKQKYVNPTTTAGTPTATN